MESLEHQVVVKASGLAAGKGVLLPKTKDEAVAAIKHIMKDRAFGEAGDEVVIEKCLFGQEISVLAFSDGYTFQVLPIARDHKRAYDNDEVCSRCQSSFDLLSSCYYRGLIQVAWVLMLLQMSFRKRS